MLLLALFLKCSHVSPPNNVTTLVHSCSKLKTSYTQNPGTKKLFTTLLHTLVQDYTPACQLRSSEHLACPSRGYRQALLVTHALTDVVFWFINGHLQSSEKPNTSSRITLLCVFFFILVGLHFHAPFPHTPIKKKYLQI